MREYLRLGLKPLINAEGTVTIYGGSTPLASVAGAAAEASQAYVRGCLDRGSRSSGRLQLGPAIDGNG